MVENKNHDRETLKSIVEDAKQLRVQREKAEQEKRRRQEFRSATENFILRWFIIFPITTGVSSLGLMILMAGLSSIDGSVPAIGWWTCVKIMAGWFMLLTMLGGALRSVRRTR